MQYAHVGASGLEISRLFLGMMSFGDHSQRDWHLDLDAARPMVRPAAEAGITAYDTADVYDRGVSEEVTGRLLRELFGRREEYVLCTKVYYPMSETTGDRGLSRRHIVASIDASLRRLGTDHVDLYYVHRWDCETPSHRTRRQGDEGPPPRGRVGLARPRAGAGRVPSPGGGVRAASGRRPGVMLSRAGARRRRSAHG